MNIQEAIKSGKRFHRKGRALMGPSPTPFGYIQYNDNKITGEVRFKQEDILADDYELEEEKIELTREQILNAIFESEVMIGGYAEGQICKRLGFDVGDLE